MWGRGKVNMGRKKFQEKLLTKRGVNGGKKK